MSGHITIVLEDVPDGEDLLAGLVEEIGRDFPNLTFAHYALIGDGSGSVIIVLEPEEEDEDE